MDRIFFITLGLWAFLFAISKVTNLQIVWQDPIMGLAALACGIVCLIRALK